MPPFRRTRSDSRNDSTPPAYSSIDETTCLLPHERGPMHEPATPHQYHKTTLHPIDTTITLTQAPASPTDRDDDDDEEEADATTPIPRTPDLEHVLSRIDTIEIGLWHNRLAVAEGLTLGAEQEQEEEEEEEEEGLSRTNTCVCSNIDIERNLVRKSISISPSTRRDSDSKQVFWCDVLGIGVLVAMVLGMMGFVGFEGWVAGGCEGKGMGFWVVVQMLVSLGFGLCMQVPVRRWMLGFVLPGWVVAVLGVMGVLRWWLC